MLKHERFLSLTLCICNPSRDIRPSALGSPVAAYTVFIVKSCYYTVHFCLKWNNRGLFDIRGLLTKHCADMCFHSCSDANGFFNFRILTEFAVKYIENNYSVPFGGPDHARFQQNLVMR